MKKTTIRTAKGFTLVELLVVISIIALLAGLATPQVMKAMGRAERLKGINSGKAIKASLDNFAMDFDGEYPSDSTAKEIEMLMDDNVGSSSRLKSSRLERSGGLQSSRLKDRRSAGDTRRVDDSTSNQYYQQLIARKALDDEEMFYVKAHRKSFRTSKPDLNGELESGECVFGYTKGLLQTSTGRLPVVFDTPISTGDNPKFSKKVWEDSAIIVKLNGSAEAVAIAGSDPKSGPIRGKVDGETMNIFSPEALEEGILVPADVKVIGGGN